MKKLILIAAAVVSAVAIAADATANQGRKRRPPRRGGRSSGGIIEKAYSGKVFRIVNAQTNFCGEALAKLTRDVRYAALLPIECVQGEAAACPFEAAEKLVATPGVGAGAVIVSDAKLPIMTISPDRRWGVLNIAPLQADNPTSEKFAERFGKLYWNIVARTLGAGNSSYPGCVLMPFANMAQLDAIKATRPCPEPFNKMIDTGKAYGIGIISIASYRMACQQGWAPAPTNEVQKVIWEQVKAEANTKPSNPMKITKEKK